MTEENTSRYSFLGMPAIIQSEAMLRLLEVVRRVAQVDTATVLITGESGAGKELVARAIHHYSRRARQPWVDVNCGALPENLVESELFGHERGAFSSADAAKPGLFEMADRGTLFLDEISELDPRMQAKLLRVLDGGRFFRLGGTRQTSVDVRVVAATNQNLPDRVREGRFRADLFHRLSQIQLEVPPLRERRADILPLARYFLEQHKPEGAFVNGAAGLLENYPWPGNVRELRNVILRAAVMAPGDRIEGADLPEAMPGGAPADLEALARFAGHNGHGSADWTLEGMERRMISRALEKTRGHHQRAADLLGISRRTLSRKLKAYAEEDLG